MKEENKNIVDESKINGLEEEILDVKSNKNLSGLYILIIFLILLVVGIFLFKFFVNKSSNNAINNSNNDNVSVVTKSDDVTSNDDVTSSDDVNFDSHYKAVKEVTLNNDYEDDTVALIYRFKSEHCDI
jgi:cytoskeletal protein RodZ